MASSSRSDFYRRGAPDLNSSGLSVEIGAHKYKPRDPRMQSLSGHFDQNVFEKRYEFLEKMQDDEIERLKKRCNAWKMTGKKGNKMRKKLGLTSANTAEEDEAQLKRLLQERASRMDAKVLHAAKSTVKKKIRDEVAAGKRGVYYLKRREMKKLELEAKFDQLRKLGGDAAVNKALAKRRKKKMGKDAGLMPNVSG
jgi:ribosomal RNA-processing protein 36